MITFHWHTEPLLIGLILLACWLYACGIGPLRSRLAPGQPYPARAAGWFYLGVALAYMTVGSPLDQVGERYLFWAHMLQHVLLIYLVPPFLIAGMPTWLVDSFLQHLPVRKLVRLLTHPAPVFLVFTMGFTIWHMPSVYELALHNKGIHILQHTFFFLSGMAMWWAFISTSKHVPRASYGVQILYVSVLMIGGFPVFAGLCFTSEVLYPTYEYAARLEFMGVGPFDPLSDQRLGGALMKVVSDMFVSLPLMFWSFYQWWKAEGDPRTQKPAPLAGPEPVAR